jgi:hypothetical protein
MATLGHILWGLGFSNGLSTCTYFLFFSRHRLQVEINPWPRVCIWGVPSKLEENRCRFHKHSPSIN